MVAQRNDSHQEFNELIYKPMTEPRNHPPPPRLRRAGEGTKDLRARVGVGCLALTLALVSAAAQAPDPAMSFFVTSVGRGFGGNLGGLAGADAHCQRLAAAVGQGQRTWRAYLSAPAAGDQPVVHARDRIGQGPWTNARGVQIASSVEHLHGDDNGLTRDTALTEKGATVAPGRHDILTGSNVDGTLATGARDTTCGGWTSHGAGSAMLGHHNRYGGGQRPTSWNSAHPSRGCSQAELRASLGDGLLYCFAAN
jgi:hypothetical protein